MITGNVRQCKLLVGKDLESSIKAAKKNDKGVTADKHGHYAGCNTTVLKCPSPKKDDKEHSYIKQTCADGGDNCSIQFPAYMFKCKDIVAASPPKSSVHSNVPTPDTCDNYYLFDMITKKDKGKGTKASRKNKHKITLGDMCPYQCNKSGKGVPVAAAAATAAVAAAAATAAVPETRCKLI